MTPSPKKSQHVVRIVLPMPFGMGKVNCYLCQTSAGYFLIDSGTSTAWKELHRGLVHAGCREGNLKMVLFTHGDFDHIGNAIKLRCAFGACLAMHKKDAGMAEHGDMFWNRNKPNRLINTLLPIFTGFGKSKRFKPDVFLEDDEELSQFGFDAKVVSIPGHSKGSIGIITKERDLFCGDLFENIKKPSLNSLLDDPAAGKTSVTQLKKLNIKRVFPGHGEPFTLEQLSKA